MTTTVRLVMACACGRINDRPVPYTCPCGREYVAAVDVPMPDVLVEMPRANGVITDLKERG